MSSFIGHALVGLAIGCREKQQSRYQSICIPLFFALLAISPDIDYLFLWLAGLSIEPRYTHSFGFCICVGFICLLFKKTFLHQLLGGVPAILFFITPLSHLILDYLVGVYSSPVFWPLSQELLTSPFGILPSAGRINFFNYYFWRNLLIELGILIPISLIIVPRLRSQLSKRSILALATMLFFIVSIIIGLNLQR